MANSEKIKLTYSIDDTFENDKFMKLRLKVCHNARSLHNTKFTTESLLKAQSSIANSPILAHIYENDKGELEMGAHDINIEEDYFDNDNLREIFLEQPVGLIPENNNYEIVEEDGVSYVYCDGYIWKGYSNYCVDLLKRSDRIKLSMEVEFLDYNYDRGEDCYIIKDFIYLGITLLGEQHCPAMQNSGATIVNYSTSDKNITLEDIRCEMKKVFSAEKINEKGEIEMSKETIEAILEEFGVSESELDFEITDDMTEEELRTKLQEYIDSKTDDINSDTSNTEGCKEPEADNSTGDANTDIATNPNEDPVDSRYSVSFSLSYEDKRCRIYSALAEAFDDEFWILETYDTHVIVESFMDGKYYKINYTENDGAITIDENFIEVFNLFLTADEKAEVEKQRSEYEALATEVESLREFKLESENAEKEVIFSEFDEALGDNADYSAIKNDKDKYSVSEIEDKCYALFGRINAKFSTNDTIRMISFSSNKNINNVENSREDIFDALLY